MKYSKEELLKMHEHMVEARIFAQKIEEYTFAGDIRTVFHTPLGQEAIGVGMMSAMADKDWFVPTHRSQAATMMRFPKYPYIAEFFCRRDGVQKGTTFDYHLSDHDCRIPLPVALLGADFPIYTGFAWALKHQGIDEAVVIECGDGAASEGAVYEAWNLAALFKVPAVYLVIENGWAYSVPFERQSANPNISEKAVPIGLPNQVVDGNDILAVREAFEKALKMAHDNIPNVIECKTLRWGPHSIGTRVYPRWDEELVEESKVNNCPIKRLEKYMLENNVVDEKYIEDKWKSLEENLVELMEKAKEAPFATFEEIFNKENIYANPESGGDL